MAYETRGRRFRAAAVVCGHLDIPRTIRKDGETTARA